MDVINAKSNTYPFVEVVIYSEILRTNCRMNQSSSHLATPKSLGGYLIAPVRMLRNAVAYVVFKATYCSYYVHRRSING